jgi:hypothetical protein
MGGMTRRIVQLVLAIPVVLALVAPTALLQAWGGQGHRLVGLIAARHLSPSAAQHVTWLLGRQSLADVSSWADRHVSDQVQTSWWHYLNIPPDAAGYDRDRDCPRQPGVSAGSRSDTWRDCVVDRILYFEQRLADTSLDRADRATALKYVVHFIGDLHQPFHALGVGRGGNDVKVSIFGSAECGRDPARPVACNMHVLWDERLITHRNLQEPAYFAALEALAAARGWATQAPGTPAEWATQSWAHAKTALVAPGTNIDEAYYDAQIGVVDERLALGGLRLAAVLNRALVGAVPE